MRDTFIKTLIKETEKNSDIILITGDLGFGVLDEFINKFPDNYINAGVAEQNMTGMAAGMAMDGFVPYVNTISTFLTRRCYEQICIDVCLHDLPVRLIGNGGGLVYAPLGPTHQAIEDIAIMRTIPNMNIIAPCDSNEMKKLMFK